MIFFLKCVGRKTSRLYFLWIIYCPSLNMKEFWNQGSYNKYQSSIFQRGTFFITNIILQVYCFGSKVKEIIIYFRKSLVYLIPFTTSVRHNRSLNIYTTCFSHGAYRCLAIMFLNLYECTVFEQGFLSSIHFR